VALVQLRRQQELARCAPTSCRACRTSCARRSRRSACSPSCCTWASPRARRGGGARRASSTRSRGG
jgi:hypothetical protein